MSVNAGFIKGAVLCFSLSLLFTAFGCISGEGAGRVRVHGRYHKMEGKPLHVSQLAPDFTVMDMTFSPVRLNELRGSLVVLNVIPSVDDSLSEKQTLTLLRDASAVSPLVKVVTISMDQPLTLKRFCVTHGLKDVYMWSDLARRDFGTKYGVFIPDYSFLARSIFIVREDGRISHVDVSGELSREPDYAEAIDILRQLL